jgi:hypothetical protein
MAMLSNRLLLAAMAASSFVFLAQPASAQATRTWVSGVGNDANPCSRTAPCKTFAGAISRTAAGGEISVLDPGGYGAVSITKSITIDGGGGQVASILAAATQGIIVNAGANDVVTLRNIRINGVRGTPFPGLNGVRFLAGAALHIENCTIFGFSQNGVDVNVNTASPVKVTLSDSTLTNNNNGLSARNAGAGNVFLALNRMNISQNTSAGVRMDGSGAGSVLSAVADSMLAHNSIGLQALGGPAPAATIQITRSSVVHSTTNGAAVSGANGFIFVSNTLMSGNATALSATAGGTLLTYKNNSIDANFAPGAFTGQLIPE